MTDCQRCGVNYSLGSRDNNGELCCENCSRKPPKIEPKPVGPTRDVAGRVSGREQQDKEK